MQRSSLAKLISFAVLTLSATAFWWEGRSSINLEPEPPSPSLAVPDAPPTAEVVREMIDMIIASEQQEAEWGTRVIKVELAPLVDQLWQARQMGLEPAPARYDDAAFAAGDSELLEALELRLQKSPELTMELENLFRRYQLMNCETVDAAIRSWLACR